MKLIQLQIHLIQLQLQPIQQLILLIQHQIPFKQLLKTNKHFLTNNLLIQ